MCTCVRVCVPTMEVRGQREESGAFSQYVGSHIKVLSLDLAASIFVC